VFSTCIFLIIRICIFHISYYRLNKHVFPTYHIINETNMCQLQRGKSKHIIFVTSIENIYY
jgi:hypothetical protein